MIQKLSVATRRGGVFEKTEKIIKCMLLHPEGITPKYLSLKTGLNVNTIKSLLPKIPGVKKILRGLYKVVERGDGTNNFPPDELRDWTFHNCILQYQGNPKIMVPFKEECNYKIIKIIVECSKKGLVTCRVSTDYPLNVSSLSLVYGLFKDFIIGVPTMDEVYIKTIEFNKDYSNLRLDGVRCITVDSLIEQFKVYQKRRGMRMEHKTKVPLTVDTVVEMLTTNPNTLELNVKLANQMKQINRLTQETQKNTAILMKIIQNSEVKG